MPNTFLQPAGHFVLVRDNPREIEVDGLALPDNMKQQEMIFGSVIAVGPDAADVVKQHDIVCYGPYAGKTILLDGIDLRVINEGQIELYVRKSN